MDVEDSVADNSTTMCSKAKIIYTVVEGTVVCWTGRMVLFQFEYESKKVFAVFRANMIYVNGERVKTKDIKNKEEFFRKHGKNVKATNIAPLMQYPRKRKCFTLDREKNETVCPSYNAYLVWIGDTEPSKEIIELSAENIRERRCVQDEIGEVIYYNPDKNIGFLRFEEEKEEPSTVQFSVTQICVDQKWLTKDNASEILNKLFSESPKRLLKFDAKRKLNLEHVTVDLSQIGEGMETEMTLKPAWSAILLWPPGIERPILVGGPEKSKDNSLVTETSQFREAIEEGSYFGGKLEKIIDTHSGILNHNSKLVYFAMDNLTIDGASLRKEFDSLFNLLRIGDYLNGFFKSRPKLVLSDGTEISYEASAVWKGRRKTPKTTKMEDNASEKGPEKETNSMPKKKSDDKNVFPMPWEATLTDVDASILETDGVIGKAKMKNEEGRVLFTRSRSFVEGRHVKFRADMDCSFKPGVEVKMDLVVADPKESRGEYDYVAVLAWIGDKPNRGDVIREIENPVSYKAKVLRFGPSKQGEGLVSGVLQITGPSHCGERVIFTRDVVHVFSCSMAKGDLAYVMKESDKVNVEFKPASHEEQESSLSLYGSPITLKATCVWIGTFPRATENSVNDSIISPFLVKRKLDIDTFKKIIDGAHVPKNVSTSVEEPSTKTEEEEDYVLPPNTITGRLIEIKKPSAGSTDGTKRGIMLIENGPHAKSKAFFNRNCFYVFGHNMHKADLMQVVKHSDKFCLEIQGDTNNKSVPFKITRAWIGPNPSDGKKETPSKSTDKKFLHWLESHHLTSEQFDKCVSGQSDIVPFFPFPSEQMSARVIYFYPTKVQSEEVEFGILKITQGSLLKKDVVFEREVVHIFSTTMKSGNLSSILKEGDKVFCEVSEIVGSDRKSWQTRLGVAGVPNYCAKLVWIGGARPRPFRPNEDFEKHHNLKQWLRKRNLSMGFFAAAVRGLTKSKKEWQNKESNSYDSGNGERAKDKNNVNPPRTNPIMRRAEEMLHRIMKWGSPEDPRCQDLITSDTDLDLALFLCKSLKNAIDYRFDRDSNSDKRILSSFPTSHRSDSFSRWKNESSYNEDSFRQNNVNIFNRVVIEDVRSFTDNKTIRPPPPPIISGTPDLLPPRDSRDYSSFSNRHGEGPSFFSNDEDVFNRNAPLPFSRGSLESRDRSFTPFLNDRNQPAPPRGNVNYQGYSSSSTLYDSPASFGSQFPRDEFKEPPYKRKFVPWNL